MTNYKVMTENNNVILVFGDGRNSGKTSLSEQIITYLSKQKVAVGAIKISTHIHDKSLENISESNDYFINIEKDPTTSKDSSRLLKAGANPVFFVQADDKHLKNVFSTIQKQSNQDKIWVIESAGARKIFKPALFIFTKKDNLSEKNNDLLELADVVTYFNDETFSLPFQEITNRLDMIINTLKTTNNDKF